MTNFQDTIFISEILLQSKIAQRAFERLRAANENLDRLEVWCSIQSILVSAANISKILWPSKSRLRGEILRTMLQIDADNILSNRRFRNHFEHYDERIEDWFDNRSNSVYVDLVMNPSLNRGFGDSYHRGYNLFENTLMFHGERLDLNMVLSSLIKVHENCKLYVLDWP